jgi:hypothetical protein
LSATLECSFRIFEVKRFIDLITYWQLLKLHKAEEACRPQLSHCPHLDRLRGMSATFDNIIINAKKNADTPKLDGQLDVELTAFE